MGLQRCLAGFAAAVLVWALPQLAAADPPTLTPANPQPDAGVLQSGLYVDYAYPADIRWLRETDGWYKHRKKGKPLIGFDYPDTLQGEPALTSDSSEYVIAFIDGFIRFPQAGVYHIEFWSNDGLRVEIGGIQVYEHDGRHPCETLGPKPFNVPEAGWYPVTARYFQRRITSCMLMKWKPPGGALDWAPLDIYGYLPR